VSKWIAFFSLLWIGLCAQGSDFHTVKIFEDPREVRIPKLVWEELAKQDGKTKVTDSSGIFFFPISVRLVEKNAKVFKIPRIEIVFQKGGGHIDLAKYAGESNGGFFLEFRFEGMEQVEDLKVFYISRTKPGLEKGRRVGSDCGQVVELSKWFRDQIKNSSPFLSLNSTEFIHLRVVGGTFVFAYKKDKQTYLSQVSLKDSRRDDLACEPLAPSEDPNLMKEKPDDH
jgi:hypothetical protein